MTRQESRARQTDRQGSRAVAGQQQGSSRAGQGRAGQGKKDITSYRITSTHRPNWPSNNYSPHQSVLAFHTHPCAASSKKKEGNGKRKKKRKERKAKEKGGAGGGGGGAAMIGLATGRQHSPSVCRSSAARRSPFPLRSPPINCHLMQRGSSRLPRSRPLPNPPARCPVQPARRPRCARAAAKSPSCRQQA